MEIVLKTFIITLLISTTLFSNEKVSLALKWKHQFQFAGYYAALEKGFYDEVGLDVELIERDTTKNHIKEVIDGRAEYGVSDSVLMVYQMRGDPIVILAPIFQHSPNVLVSQKKMGIDNPYKLDGKIINFYDNDTDGYNIVAMLQYMGIKPIIKHDRSSIDIKQMLAREDLILPMYLTNEKYHYDHNSIPVNVINPTNYGVDMYGDILFTNQDEYQTHPDRVKRFKEASIKGWEYALSHKEEIVQLIKSKYNSSKTLEHLRFEAQTTEKIIDNINIPIGTLDGGRLEYMLKIFQNIGMINKEAKLENIFYDKSMTKTIFTQEEQDWIKSHPIVKVAADPNWAPFEFIDEKGEYKGITSDYLNLISQRTNITFKVERDKTWAQLVEMVKNRELDMFSCVVKNEERGKYSLFTQPYIDFPTVIVTNDKINYVNGPKELKGKTVSVVKGYITEHFLKEEYPYIHLKFLNNIDEALESVSVGESYAYVGNLGAIGYSIKKNGLSNLKISGHFDEKFSLSMAVREDWEMLQTILDKALVTITQQERDAIYNNWINIEYEQKIDYYQIAKYVIPFAIFLIVLLYFNYRLQQAQKTLKALSITDHLTKIYNRVWLDKTLLNEIEKANRYKTDLALMIIDLDNFKQINDTYGHQVGDIVLIELTQLIQHNIRNTDVFGRWGGEEFMIICPGLNNYEVNILGEKLCTKTNERKFESIEHLTISIGVSYFHLHEDVDALIKRADDALYQAKANGKNQVVRL